MTWRLHWNREGSATRPSLYGKMACRRPRWCELTSMYICANVAPGCRSAGNNYIALYRIIRLGLGAYLHSSSVLLPPCSLPRNSCTFPKTLVMGSYPARPRRVRSSDTDPVPHHDEPVRLHIVAYSLLQDQGFVFTHFHGQHPICSPRQLTI